MMADGLPHRNLYTRLKVSPYGIGVFAIRDIPEGLRLFEGDEGAVVRVPRTVVDQIENAEMRRMYFDFCPMLDETYVAPVNFNLLTMCWYLNHSAEPNVNIDGNLHFGNTYASPGEVFTIPF